MEEKKNKVILAADHAGYEVKEKLKQVLEENEIPLEDYKPEFEEGDDYPDFIFKAGKKVVREKARGVFICGSGIGVCMAANKVKGIRAGLCINEKFARLARQHNDTNVLCLSGREVDIDTNIKILKAWLTTRFLEGRHTRRVNKVIEFEK